MKDCELHPFSSVALECLAVLSFRGLAEGKPQALKIHFQAWIIVEYGSVEKKKAALCTCVLDVGSDFLYSCGSEMAETMKAPICTANGTVYTFPVQAEPRSQLYKQNRPLMALELKQHRAR